MNRKFSLPYIAILLLLLLLILAPRPLAGFTDLHHATQASISGDSLLTARLFASAASRLPWRPDLWGMAGRSAWQAGDADLACKDFAHGNSSNALSQADWLAYGDALLSQGDPSAARHAWEQSLLQHGPSAPATLRLALVARSSGDYLQAISLLRQSISLDPQDAGAHYLLGLLLAATSPQNALPELMEAARLDPQLDPVVQLLRAELNRAFLDENRAYQFTVSGKALASLGEWALAGEAFHLAVAADPEFGEAWAWLGESFQQSGRDGRPQLDQALRLAPLSASVRALDGLYWMRQGQPDKAIASFQKAAAIEPHNPAWQVSLGDATVAKGDLVSAGQYYRQATDLAPADPATWRALALFSLENSTDIQNTGLHAGRMLLRLAPDDWLTQLIAGRLAILLDAPFEAESHLLQAILLAPGEAAPHYYLALAYLEDGQTALAYDKLVDTAAMDPQGAFGWQAGRLLETYFP